MNRTGQLPRIRPESSREGGRRVAILQDIVLAPLGREDLERLVGDSFHSELERAAPLAQLIHGENGPADARTFDNQRGWQGQVSL